MVAINYEFFDYQTASKSELAEIKANPMKYYINMKGETVGTLFKRKKSEEKKKFSQNLLLSEIRSILSKSYEQALRSQTSIIKSYLLKRNERDILVKNVAENVIANAYDLKIKKYLESKRAEFESFINEVFKDCAHNLHNRVKRFQRKAMFNMTKYCYFITISYSDDNFFDEESFREALKGWFSRCHSRKGSFVQGVFERGSSDNRLHFHGLMYVPDGFFKDGLVERKVYSTKKQKWISIMENPTLRRKFGQNDFSRINQYNIVEHIKYICKYIAKSGERFFYNRGIKGEALAPCDIKKINFISDDFVRHYLFDSDVRAFELDKRSIVDFYSDTSKVFSDDFPLRE